MRWAWGRAILFTLILLAGAPWAAILSGWLRGHHLLRIVVGAASALLILYLIIDLRWRLRIVDWRAYAFLSVIGGAALLLAQGVTSVEEKIHFLEFTLLAFFFFKAVKFSQKGARLYGISLLLTTLVGWIDEIWQGILPQRVYDVRDVFFNACGGMIGVGVGWVRQAYGREAA